MRTSPLAWRREQLAEGLDLLVSMSRLRLNRASTDGNSGADGSVRHATSDVPIDQLVAALGLEAECVHATYGEVDSMLSGAGPAVVQVGGGDADQYLLLLGCRRSRMRVIRPDGRVEAIPFQTLKEIVCAGAEGPIREETELLLRDAGIKGGSLSRARRAILNRRLASEHIGSCWMVRLPPNAHFGRQLQQEGILARLGAVLSLHAVQQVLFVGSWWVIGRAVLQGRLDIGYFLAWILLLASIIPVRLLENWWQSELLFRVGALVKRRLLAGVLRFDPDRLRKEGSGRLLAQVLESAAIENTTLTGGLLTILACVDLVATGIVLLSAPRSALFMTVFIVWIGMTTLGTWRYITSRRRWMMSRLSMSEDLVEKLVAHRTRMAQERPGNWHAGEDEAIDAYYQASIRMDHAGVAMSLVARGWLIAGMAVLASVLMSSTVSMGLLAVAMAGVLMGAQALTRFNAGLGNLTTAIIAIGRIAPVFRAGGTAEPNSTPAFPGQTAPLEADAGGRLLETHQLSFRYEGRDRPALDSCNLRVEPGQRVLIEGPSGSGKSTFAKILTTMLPAQKGLLMLRGLDCSTVGTSDWRRRVSYVPQFHENHVFTGTLAFNLLMGRAWPPSTEDLSEAETVCRELGLGDLLSRMPSGLMQAVGETGWQLSHGEKSRIFLARSLLCEPDVVVADEPFAALDPTSLRQCLRSLVNRKPAVVLIAHR